MKVDADVVVVGSGLGGLTSALKLANQGLKVCVVEQHLVPGGCAHNFRRKNYTFDVSLHYIGSLGEGCIINGVLKDLGVFNKLSIKRRESLFTAEFPEFSITLPNNFDELLHILCQKFPHQATPLIKLFKHLKILKHHVMTPWVDPNFDVPWQKRLSLNYLQSTFLDLLTEFVTDPELLAILGQQWMYIGLPPSQSTATFSTCVFCSSFLEGAYHIEGGGGALAKAMVERLEELGGSCLLRSPVTKIMVKNSKVLGVELAKGQQIYADVVISNANPYQTFFKLISDDDISQLYRMRLKKMTPSLSLYTMYLGLDCPPSKLGIPGDNFFYNYNNSHDVSFKQCLNHEISNTHWTASNYESLDHTLCAPDKGILAISEITPTGDWLDLPRDIYVNKKAHVRDILLKKYCDRFTGLEKHINVMEFGTPKTIARYTRNHQGAVYGLAQILEQSNSKRLRNRTPIKNLYLTGAWTWAGGGYEGAIMSGLQTAASVLEEIEHLSFQIPQPQTPAKPKPKSPKPDHKQAKSPNKQDDKIYCPYRLPVRVTESDCRSGQFALYEPYLRFMDRGRVEAIEALCESENKDSWLIRYTVNVYRLTANCTSKFHVGDILEVQTGIHKTSSHRAIFTQYICNTTTQKRLGSAQVEVLFLDKSDNLVSVPSILTEPSVPLPNPKSVPPIPFIQDTHFPFHFPLRVYYEDTDAQGIAYHISYLRFCERALHELLAQLWPSANQPDYSATTVDLRYIKAAHIGDYLEVRIGCRKIQGQLILDQRIVHSDSGDVMADVITTLSFVNSQGQKIEPPTELLNLPKRKDLLQTHYYGNFSTASRTHLIPPDHMITPKSSTHHCESSFAPCATENSQEGIKRQKSRIGAFLMTPENITLVGKSSWSVGRPQIIEKGFSYFEKNQAEVDSIAANLEFMDLPSRGAALDSVLKGIIAHYYEKLFVLVKTFEAYWIAKNRIDIGSSLEPFKEAKESGKAVFLGQSHFGGTYLMAAALDVHGINLNMVGKFPPPVDTLIAKNIKTITEKYGAGSTHLLNIADDTVDIPMEMIHRLKKRQFVSNVFDENNAFCKPVQLLNKTLNGGTGMDQILKNFSDQEIIVVTPFLIRTSDETFRYELDRHRLTDGNIVDSFFRSLEKRVKKHYDQWYFIHELHENFI